MDAFDELSTFELSGVTFIPGDQKLRIEKGDTDISIVTIESDVTDEALSFRSVKNVPTNVEQEVASTDESARGWEILRQMVDEQ